MTLSNFAALLWILAWMAAIWRARQVDPVHGQDWEMDSEADGERTVKRIKLSQKDVKKMHRAIGDIEGIAAGVNDNQADVLFNVLNFLEKIMKGD